MSTPLAIGAVTAVMRHLLDNVALPLIPSAFGTPSTSTVAPAVISEPAKELRLNLFLYHVTPNPGWRNRDLASRDVAGDRATNQMLALDLHYLLTAYAHTEYTAEVLLGAAMHAFHEVPVLTREQIRRVFGASGLSPVMAALKDAQIADQVEMLKITPVPMTTDESSKLWSALLTAYRPSVAYQVSVVLIEATRPAKAPLPVLRRGDDDRGAIVQPSLEPPVPTINSIELPTGRADVIAGEDITIKGHRLDGSAVRVRFDMQHISPPLEATIVSRTDRKIVATIPNAPAAWPAGPYAVSVGVTNGGEEQFTNEVPVLLAPRIARRVVPPGPATELDITVTTAAGRRTLDVQSVHRVWPLQRVWLIVGQRPIASDPRDPVTPTAALKFTVPASMLPTGKRVIRLRVDGVDSRVIDLTSTPPSFDESQTKDIPV